MEIGEMRDKGNQEDSLLVEKSHKEHDAAGDMGCARNPYPAEANSNLVSAGYLPSRQYFDFARILDANQRFPSGYLVSVADLSPEHFVEVAYGLSVLQFHGSDRVS